MERRNTRWKSVDRNKLPAKVKIRTCHYQEREKDLIRNRYDMTAMLNTLDGRQMVERMEKMERAESHLVQNPAKV